MKAKEAAALQQVTGLSYRAGQARLGALQNQKKVLEDQIRDLNDARQRRGGAWKTGPDPAFLGGADMKWQIWIEARKARINIEIARLSAEMENERVALSRKFGRDQVAQHLLTKLRNAESARQINWNDTDRG